VDIGDDQVGTVGFNEIVCFQAVEGTPEVVGTRFEKDTRGVEYVPVVVYKENIHWKEVLFNC
jgi:hypothetical protein